MQDKAIVEIGKIALKEMDNKEPYELYIQNMFPDKENYDMILAVFELKSEGEKLNCTFKNVDIQNVSETNCLKYAYRKGSARGGDITFTTKFGDIEKKLNTLVENQFKKLIARLKDSILVEDFKTFNAVYQFLLQKENYDNLKTELTKLYESLTKEQKMTSGLSILLVIDGKEYYLSDFKIIQQILTASGTEEKSEKYDVKSEGSEAICSICLQKKTTIHGFASPFKYATVDKPGMVSGFFKQENNWKNYPICTKCSLEFELGRAYITKNLSSYFYGKPYYIIPRVLTGKDKTQDLLQFILDKIMSAKGLYSNPLKDGLKVKRYEERMWEAICEDDEKSKYLWLNFLFYEENPTTKAIKIKLMLEEIPPTRFRKILVDVPSIVNKNQLYKEALYEDKKKKDLTFDFGVLKTFFEDDFYELVNTVFVGKPMAEEALYAKFLNTFRENYNKGYSLYQYVLKAHLTLSYFQELNIIPKRYFPMQNESNELSDLEVEKELEKLDDDGKESFKKFTYDAKRINVFLDEQANFFGQRATAQKGVLFLGTLVRHLLEVQGRELGGGTPFEKKLKGYALNANDLQTVYREVYGKIKQYRERHFFYFPTTLIDFVDKYFNLNFEEIKKMTVNEISFYFISGMQLINEFRAIDTPKQK